ncbi:MAG: N-acetylmuramoyl-L-alanine amidase [Mangrovibacterium sp.]
MRELVIHCSATRAGKNFTSADIDLWHRQQGWKGIGYHFVVLLDGTLQQGRALHEVGAHCKGHNAHSVGLCYIGGVDALGVPLDTRTPTQKEGLRRLIFCLRRRFPSATVHGHNEFSNKACPSYAYRE